MKAFLHWVATGLFHLGAPGLLVLGVIDSSFLTAPLGNDVLVVALTAKHHARMLFYAGVATAGSVIGCFLVDMVSRKAEAGLQRKGVSQARLKFVERQVQKRAGWAIAAAALMPPPFPFTPFVAASAGFGYPRKKLFGVLAAARFSRFAIDGLLAIKYGRHVLEMAESPAVEYFVLALIFAAFVGSGASIYTWIRKSREIRRPIEPVHG